MGPQPLPYGCWAQDDSDPQEEALGGGAPAHYAAAASGELPSAWWPVSVHRMGIYKMKGVEAATAVVQVRGWGACALRGRALACARAWV